MKTLTEKEVELKLIRAAEAILFWHTEGGVHKSLKYNYQTEVYIVTIENRIGVTKNIKDAVNNYNTG